MRSSIATLEELTIPMGAGPGTPRVRITKRIPAELATFYAPNTVSSVIQAYGTGADYEYTAWFTIPSTGETIEAIGQVSAGAVYELQTYYFDPSSGIPRTTFFGDIFGARLTGSSWQFNGVVGAPLDPFGANYSSIEIGDSVDLTVAGLSLPRGTIAEVATAGNIAITTSHAAPVMSFGNVTFPPKRAFEFRFGGLCVLSASTNVMEVMFADPAFTSFYCQGGAFGPSGAAFGIAMGGTRTVVNATGAAVTRNIGMFVYTDAGTGTFFGSTAQSGCGWASIVDVGPSSAYPNCAQI